MLSVAVLTFGLLTTACDLEPNTESGREPEGYADTRFQNEFIARDNDLKNQTSTNGLQGIAANPTQNGQDIHLRVRLKFLSAKFLSAGAICIVCLH